VPENELEFVGSIVAKAKKQKTTKNASTLIQFVPTRETQQLIEDMRKVWPERIREARKYFLLDIANYMRNELILRKPTMRIEDKQWEYAKELIIGILEEAKDFDSIAIYLKSEKEKITKMSMSRTLLYFSPKKNSPMWVSVLIKYGPWPAYLLPVKMKSKDVLAISRIARDDEIDVIDKEIMTKRMVIEQELEAAGCKVPVVGPSDNAVGLIANVDIGHQAARNEFGFLGKSQGAPWRTAFVETKKYASQCMKKIATYITNGDKNVFDLPSDIGKANKSVMKDGMGFYKEIVKVLG
jgi:hypothetical protein